MDHTPATRFVDLLGRLGYRTQQQIADLLDIARPTAGTIVRYEKPPSFESMTTLKEKHPEVNMEWVFTGEGAPFVTGDAAPVLLAGLPSPTAPAAEEPAPAYVAAATDAVVTKMLAHISELGQRHHEELKAAKKDYHKRVVEQAQLWQATVDEMERQREDLKVYVAELKQEIFDLKLRAGLREPTPAEAALFEKQAQARKEQEEKAKLEITGFRKYVEPQGVEMHVTTGDLPLEDFSWQPTADAPLTLQLAA